MRIIPLSDKFLEQGEAAAEALANAGVRVTVDRAAEKVGAKIRLARLERVPYMLVIGGREAETESVSVRHRDLEDLGTRTLVQFIEDVTAEIKDRALTPQGTF